MSKKIAKMLPVAALSAVEPQRLLCRSSGTEIVENILARRAAGSKGYANSKGSLNVRVPESCSGWPNAKVPGVYS